MTTQEAKYAYVGSQNWCAIIVDWNESVSNTSVSYTIKVSRWDGNYVDASNQTFSEQLTGGSNPGSWSGYSWPSGSGTRQADTFGTRSITRTHSAQSVTLKISTNAYFATIDPNGFRSIGAVSPTFTLSIPAKPSYTVSYNANGGSGAPGSQTKWYGENLTLSSTAPTRTGYTFKGWATSSGGGVAYAKGATYTGNAALTLYAVWQINTWSVTYNGNGATGGSTASQTKTYNQNLTLQQNGFTRTNYVFKRWNTNASDTGTAYNAGATYTGNAALALYAIWYAPYTITYNANGGTDAPAAGTKVYNQAYTVSSSVPTRENYNFTGWNTAADGTGTSYASGGTIAAASNANVTLYAQWTIAHNSPTISSLLVQRCLSDGTLDPEGTRVKVTAEWSVDTNGSAFEDTEGYEATILMDGTTDTVSLSGTSGTIQVVHSKTISISSEYQVLLTVTDTKEFSSSRASTVSMAYFTVHYKAGGQGVSFGSPANEDGFNVSMPMLYRHKAMLPYLVFDSLAWTNDNLSACQTAVAAYRPCIARFSNGAVVEFDDNASTDAYN